MRADVYIGIDMGSTGLKALAFEPGSGAALAASGGALPYQRLPRGGCQLAEQAIRSSLLNALRHVAKQLGPRIADVRALCCTGHGGGLYALDAQQRLLGGHAVASTDQRAAARARAVAVRHGEALFQTAGCGPWAGQPTLIVAELFGAEAARRGQIHRLLFAKDYLAFLLTGEMATDASDAGTAGLLDLHTLTWSALAFEAAGLHGLPAAMLPRILPSGTVIGTLRPAPAAECGLPQGLPVAMGTIDLLASLTAVGAQASGHAVAVLGTWCVNAVVGPVMEPPPAVGAVVNFGLPGQRLYLENSPSSMANVAWLAAALQFPSAAAVVDCAMSAPLGAAGLRFLPFVNGGAAPPGASAGFIGLQAHHDRSHMARAVVDAVAALHARHLRRLGTLGLGVSGAAAALGGGARDARLVQLLASFLGHPVERCGDDETGARGAAIYAAVSQGAAPADERCVRAAPAHAVEPIPGEERAHADFLGEFDALIDALAPAFRQLSQEAR